MRRLAWLLAPAVPEQPPPRILLQTLVLARFDSRGNRSRTIVLPLVRDADQGFRSSIPGDIDLPDHPLRMCLEVLLQRAKKVFLAMCLPRCAGHKLMPRFSMQIGLEPEKNPLSLSLSSEDSQPSGYGEDAAKGPKNL